MAADEMVRSAGRPGAEGSFPAWPPAAAAAIALPAPSVWAAEREALKAAAVVAGLVGVPAVIAAGAVLVLFALTAVVLLAPLVALLLTWLAWRCNRRVALLPAEPADAGRQRL